MRGSVARKALAAAMTFTSITDLKSSADTSNTVPTTSSAALIPPIDVQGLACDIARLLGKQVGGGRRDFAALRESPEWNRGLHMGALLCRVHGEHRRFDDAGCDGVDADAFGRVLGGQSHRKADDA